MNNKIQTKWFCSIAEANKITGLSFHQLRAGVHSGEIESIKSGDKFLINMPKLAAKYNIPLMESTNN